MNDSSSSRHENGQPLTPARLFVILVVLLTGYVVLAYLLHITAIFAGSLFFFFWAGFKKVDPAAFMPVLVGAIGGIANASLLSASFATLLAINPGIAAIGGIALLMLAVYLLLIEKIPVLFNQSYMLFVTVGAIPQLSGVKMLLDMVEGILFSAAYFGSVLWVLRRIGARRDANTVSVIAASRQN